MGDVKTEQNKGPVCRILVDLLAEMDIIMVSWMYYAPLCLQTEAGPLPQNVRF